MGKLFDELQKQLNTEHKKAAEDCIKIYNKLKELNKDGCVWNLQWRQLVDTHFEGNTLSTVKRWYEPTKIGYVFLKGIESLKQEKERTYQIQMVLISHLSDCQELLSLSENREYVSQKINFVKALLLKYGDNLNQEVNEEELNHIFSKNGKIMFFFGIENLFDDTFEYLKNDCIVNIEIVRKKKSKLDLMREVAEEVEFEEIIQENGQTNNLIKTTEHVHLSERIRDKSCF